MNNIAEKRHEKGLSQSELASKADVNVRMIQHYEQGVKNFNKAQVETAIKIAHALECAVEDLVNVD